MHTLDEKLIGLRSTPSDPRLGAMDAAVFSGLAALGARQTARSHFTLAASIALAIGMMGSIAPGNDAQAAAISDGLMAPPALAPSQLLRS